MADKGIILKPLLEGGIHTPGHIAGETELKNYSFEPKGILKDRDGNVAGIWIKGKRGKRYIYLLEKPVPPAQSKCKVELRDVEINGTIYRDVPVEIWPPVSGMLTWGSPGGKGKKGGG